MGQTFFPTLVVVLAGASLIRAIPSHGSSLSLRQSNDTIDCHDLNPETLYDASCWAKLDLSNFLNNWRAPKVCNTGVNCCKPDEEWSTCFLRLGKGDSGLNCTMIASNTNDCAYNRVLAEDLDPSIKAQVRCITGTIFST